MIFGFFILLLQVSLYLFFIIKFSSFLFAEIVFGASFLFLIYLSNCEGRNEFKLAWILPTFLFPFFGISIYIYTKMSERNSKLRKKLRRLRLELDCFLPKQDDIQSSFPEVSDLAFYLYKDVSFPAYTDTTTEYFSCGEDFLPDFIFELKKAKSFILLEFFIINPGEAWDRILDILTEKVKEGVEVKVLYDGIGSVAASAKSYHEYLKSLGIQTRIYMPFVPIFNLEQNNRDHRKIAIIDGKVAYTGGLNISNEYFNIGINRFSYWKDSAVKLRGNAIKSLTNLFLQTWHLVENSTEDFGKYFPEIKNETNEGLVIPYGDDAYNEKDSGENICLYILGKARYNVYITTPYIVIDNQLKEALIFAAKRGVEVSLIVPSKPDHFFTFCVGKTFLKTLVENGVHVYLYLPGFIHSKLFVADGEIATVGSVNLDYRSFFHNFEDGIVLYKKTEIKKIQYDIEKTILSCQEMKVEDYKKLPFHIKMFGRVLKIFSPLI